MSEYVSEFVSECVSECVSLGFSYFGFCWNNGIIVITGDSTGFIDFAKKIWKLLNLAHSNMCNFVKNSRGV